MRSMGSGACGVVSRRLGLRRAGQYQCGERPCHADHAAHGLP